MSTSIVNIGEEVFNLRRFLALFRDDLYTPYELALRAIARGQYDDAVARLDELVANPALAPAERAAAANKRGVAFVRMRREQEAREAFEGALALVPRFAPALVNLGNLSLEAGRTQEAVALYEDAVRADDEYALAHHNLGVAYKRLGRTNDAVRELKRAHRLEGRNILKQSKQR